MNKKRVVVTGMGAVTPIGNDVESFWQAIKAGKNGIDFITRFDTTDYQVKIAAEVKDFDPKENIDRKELRGMDLYTQYAVVAAKQALTDANIVGNVDPNRFGTIISSGIGGLISLQESITTLAEKGPKRVSPFFIPKAISNMAAGNVAIMANAKGICTAITTACASGSHAIGEAFRKIQYGEVDAIICGGSEASIVETGVAGFSQMMALSTKNDPNRASIPFDKERDGFVMGEGAGILILEDYEHAQQRGAHIYGEIVGYGATCDAYHITAPDGNGGKRCMEAAIQDANINKEDIDYINAHGTSTPLNDKFETKAIKDAFGDYAGNLKVSSTKSMTGHLLGAAGAVEAIVLINALKDNFIPATINYQTKDEECDLNYVPNQGINEEIKYALSNSLGFGGHNATLIFKKYEEE